MNFAAIGRSILGFFGLHKFAEDNAYVRRTLLNAPVQLGEPTHFMTDAEAAEVDNEKQRYTARRYVAAMLEWEEDLIAGRERHGFKEWQRYLLPMMIHRRDEFDAFTDEVGRLMEAGEWKPVLTAEQQEEKRRNILARRDEIIAESLRPMDSYDAGMLDDDTAEPVTEEERDAVVAKALAEAGIEPWPELTLEEGDDDEEEGHEDEDHLEFEIEIGEDDFEERR